MNANAAPPMIPPRNPLGAIQRLGRRASREGIYVGIIVALVGHLAAMESPRYSMIQMRSAVKRMRGELHRYYWATYDVEVLKEQREPEPEPEPKEPAIEEPEPEPEPEAIPEPEPEVEPEEIPEEAEPAEEPDDIYEDVAPEAAEAGKVLTSEGPVDLTDQGIVTGDGRYRGGRTASEGTSKKAVHDRRARAGGKEGGTGTGTERRRPRKKNLSRPAMPVTGQNWSSCGFPPQADLEQIDRAVATVSVTVGPSGSARSARVVSDPGYGFGALAKACAMAKRYEPARNADGEHIVGTTPPIRVNFRR